MFAITRIRTHGQTKTTILSLDETTRLPMLMRFNVFVVAIEHTLDFDSDFAQILM